MRDRARDEPLTRPATWDDIREFYGDPAVPMQMVVMRDGSAIAGIAWIDGRPTAVSWIRQRMSARRLLRAAREVMPLYDQWLTPVVAHPDPEEPTAERFLLHLGFRKASDDEFVY